LNQTHLFQDLYRLVDEQEKRMFEAIDGRRSVAEIVESVKEKEPQSIAQGFLRSSGGTTRWSLIPQKPIDQ
jgi:hypothetical protein